MVGADDERFYALDQDTGSLRWKVLPGGEFNGGATADEVAGFLYAVYAGTQSGLFAYGCLASLHRIIGGGPCTAVRLCLAGLNYHSLHHFNCIMIHNHTALPTCTPSFTAGSRAALVSRFSGLLCYFEVRMCMCVCLGVLLFVGLFVCLCVRLCVHLTVRAVVCLFVRLGRWLVVFLARLWTSRLVARPSALAVACELCKVSRFFFMFESRL